MNRSPHILPALIWSLGIWGCAAPPASEPQAPVADAAADIAALNAVRQAFTTAYEAGDAEAIGKLYTENAISEPNNQPTLTGREAIVASLRGMFEQVSVQPILTSDETRTLGNVGFDRGSYTVTVTPKSGAPPSSSEGRYLVLFVKEDDGAWRVWRDIDNALMPTPSPAPAAGTETPSEMPE